MHYYSESRNKMWMCRSRIPRQWQFVLRDTHNLYSLVLDMTSLDWRNCTNWLCCHCILWNHQYGGSSLSGVPLVLGLGTGPWALRLLLIQHHGWDWFLSSGGGKEIQEDKPLYWKVTLVKEKQVCVVSDAGKRPGRWYRESSGIIRQFSFPLSFSWLSALIFFSENISDTWCRQLSAPDSADCTLG